MIKFLTEFGISVENFLKLAKANHIYVKEYKHNKERLAKYTNFQIDVKKHLVRYGWRLKEQMYLRNYGIYFAANKDDFKRGI